MTVDLLFATVAVGTEDLVAKELRQLGVAGINKGRGGVHFGPGEGQTLLEVGLRACVHLRTAMRILWPLASGKVADPDGVYELARTIAWQDHLSIEHTLAVSATTRAKEPMAHAPFLGQRVKDAVVDCLCAKTGSRPNVSRKDPDVPIYLHVAQNGAATVGLDLAGDSLHLRGYRRSQSQASLRETLAAAVVVASGWRGERALVDPMCGSGTLVIEAAMIACGAAPGIVAGERRFAPQRWLTFGQREQRSLRVIVEEAKERVRTSEVAIMGSDRDEKAIVASRDNARRCLPAVAKSITWRVADVRELDTSRGPVTVISNPPYGERLASSSLRQFWRSLGGHLRRLDGSTGFLLCGSGRMQRDLGMRPTWSRKLMNGPLAVELCRFELGRQKTNVAGKSWSNKKRGRRR